MKRITTAIAAILLAAVILAGCAPSAGPFKGTIEDNVYTSEYAELTFTAPEDWVIKAGKKLDGYLWNSDMSFDMLACDPAETWASVAYADLAAVGKTDCSEETYFDLLKEEWNKEVIGDYKFSDYTDVKVGSNSFKAMSIVIPEIGINHYFYLRRKDDYMIFIFVQISDYKDIKSVMACFS